VDKRADSRTTQEPQKKLRLTIEVDGIWADDLDESAATIAELRGEVTDRDKLFVVTEEWMRPEVILTVTTYPGEKCQNHEFEVIPYHARIVGAETVDAS
jgi:hypothetical protein